MKRLLILALPVLAACSQTAPAPARVEVTEATCRPALVGRDTTACYATLTASRDDRLVALTSPGAADVQLHEMSTEDGMMRMGEMTDGLPLPAGETVRLASGDDHLMVFGATQPLAEGETLVMTLTFEHAQPQEVSFRIAQPTAAGSHAGH